MLATIFFTHVNVVKQIIDCIATRFGHPRALKRYLELNRLQSVGITLPQPSADMGMAVMQWMYWCEGGYKLQSYWPTSNKVLGWYVDDQGQYRGWQFELHMLRSLVRNTPPQPWSGDVRDIAGITTSKGPIEKYATLDEFAEHHCLDEIQEVSVDSMMKNWRHEGRFVRSDSSILVRQLAWDDRTFWLNSGGSHHFAAARYLAGRLGKELRIEGQLLRCELVPDSVIELTKCYAILGMPTESYDAIFPELENFGVPHFLAKSPDPLKGRAIFLPLSEVRALRVARLLIQHGVFDLGAQLLADLNRQLSFRS